MERLEQIKHRWTDDGFGIAHPIIEEELDGDVKHMLEIIKTQQEENTKLKEFIEQSLREFDRGDRLEGLSLLRQSLGIE